MAGKPGRSALSGATEVAEAQKPVKLTSSSLANSAIGVWVTCDPSNTGTIMAIGSAKATTEAKKELGKVQGIVIEKKQAPIFIEISDPTELWIDVEKAKDVVTWTIILA